MFGGRANTHLRPCSKIYTGIQLGCFNLNLVQLGFSVDITNIVDASLHLSPFHYNTDEIKKKKKESISGWSPNLWIYPSLRGFSPGSPVSSYMFGFLYLEFDEFFF